MHAAHGCRIELPTVQGCDASKASQRFLAWLKRILNKYLGSRLNSTLSYAVLF